MPTHHLWLPGRFLGLNDLLLNRGSRITEKKRQCATVVLLAQAARVPRFASAHVSFEWAEPNKRRDPDNFCGGGAKVILDALQHAGVIPGDGWGHVLGLSHRWACDPKNPGVQVTLTGELA